MTRAEQLLAQIEAQLPIARAALADEHEGDLTRAVFLIAVDAAALSDLVLTW